MSDRNKPLSFLHALAFAAITLPVSAVGVAMSIYLPRHFASHLGLDLAVIGTAFSIARMIDIPVNGLLGWSMDKTRTPIGRYRFWTMLSVPLLMAGVYFLFMAPAGVGSVYLIAWVIVLFVGNSMLGLSGRTWAATLAPDYNGRSRLFGVLAAVGVLGGTLIIAIPALGEVRGVSDAGTIQIMGWFLLVLSPLAIGLAALTTPERVAPKVGGRTFRRRDVWALLGRPSYMRLVPASFFLEFGPSWMSAIYLFYFIDCRGFTTGRASSLLGIYVLSAVLGAPVLARAATKFSKHRTLISATIGYALALVAIPMLPKGQLPPTIAAMFMAGFFYSGFNLLLRAMTADVSDEVRLEGGQERAGLLFAITTMTTKTANALTIGITFSVLDHLGYHAKAGVPNTAQAIHNLELVFVGGPIVCVLLGACCMIGYRLDAERHATIRRRLDERDALNIESTIRDSVTGESTALTPPHTGGFDEELKPRSVSDCL